MHLLLVDDHPDLLDLVARALMRESHVVTCAASLAQARAALEARAPDLVVLDVALPDGTGIDLCRELRKRQMLVPILLLTAHGEVRQRVAGLDAGADDFLAKPFAMAELRARVRALLRRGAVQRSNACVLRDVELHFAARRALRAGVEVPLTTREWSLLELLASRAQRVVRRDEILEAVWGEPSEAASASLDVIATRVRRKLGAHVLRTVRSHGYALGEGSSA